MLYLNTYWSICESAAVFVTKETHQASDSNTLSNGEMQ